MIATLFTHGFHTEPLGSGARVLSAKRRLTWHCF